jgi:hypothetical protein
LPLVATPASGGVVDLLSGRPGAWLAKEISAESLAEALIAALGALLPGQRFNYGFFAREAERAAQATASKESASEHFEAGAQFPVILQGEWMYRMPESVHRLIEFLLEPKSALIGLGIAIAIMLLFLMSAGRGRSR